MYGIGPNAVFHAMFNVYSCTWVAFDGYVGCVPVFEAISETTGDRRLVNIGNL